MIKRLILIVCAAAVVLAGAVALLRTGHGEQAAQTARSETLYKAAERFDRQEEVFYLLGDRLEQLARGETTTAETAAFCEGVNIFAQNDAALSAYQSLYPEDTALQETVRALMALTTAVDQETLETLSPEKLEELAEICHALSACCDRGREGTLPDCLINEERDSAACAAALSEIDGLLDSFTAVAG